MSLWYDVDYLSTGDPSGVIATAVAEVVRGANTTEIVEQLGKIRDSKLRGRALQIVSAFWHEKRHFLDFVATNYGAFRFRQFLEVYANLPLVIKLAKSHGGRLCCPLEIYDDPVRSSLMSLSDASHELGQIAESLARRRKMVERDRTPISTRYGRMEVGGEAQLETLAYLAQARFVGNFFGIEGIKEFRESLYNVDNFSNKYFTVIETAARVGLLPFERLDPLPGTGSTEAITLDTALLEASLFASLQSDYVARGGGYFESSYPGDRLSALGMKIREEYPNISTRAPGSVGLEEAFQIVDDACKKVFGYSVADQIELDITYFENQFNEKIYGYVPGDIETISRDYFALRRRVLDRFRKWPTSIVSTDLFALGFAEQVEPNYVICSSRGQLGDPPEGYKILMGYREPDRDVEKDPHLKWWWACCPEKSSKQIFGDRADERDERICFEHPKSWYSCIDFYAPTTKLLMNGRRIRTMLGPELMIAEKRIETKYGVKLEIYPSFEFPDETIDPGVLYFYSGKDTLMCDISSEIIHRPHGKVLTPWTLRRWPRLARHVIDAMGGHEIAYFFFVRDWTGWFVSDEVFNEFQKFMSLAEEKSSNADTRSEPIAKETSSKRSFWKRLLSASRRPGSGPATK
jgi:hypothetical protein